MANADTLVKDATTAQQYAGSGSMAMPSYNISDFYSGPMQQTQKYISDPVATALTRTATPAQLSAIQAVPANSYQTPRNTPINRPNEPAGYSYADTGDNGRAGPAMRQLIGLGGAGNGAALPTAGASAPQWGQFEQAYYDAGHKPGTWTAQSRLLAQALMRQMAVRGQTRPGVGGVVPANGLPAPVRGGAVPAAIATPPKLAMTPAQAAARAANFGGGTEVINSNGNYVTSNGEWHYSDPAHSGFVSKSGNTSSLI